MGGQAVFEGVLIRTPSAFAVAVRRQSGEIVVRRRAFLGLATRFHTFRGFLSSPFVRGIVALIESALCALEGISFAAAQAGSSGPLAGASIDALGDAGQKRPTFASMMLSVSIAAVLAVGLFVALPHACAHYLSRTLGHAWSRSGWQYGAAVGASKLAFLVAYLWALRTLRDIKRLFMYHGAEHKVIATLCADKSITLLNVRDAPLRSDTCGTGFVLALVAVTIILYSVLLPYLLPGLASGARLTGLAILLKVVFLLPLWATVYEIRQLLRRLSKIDWLRRLLAPGRALQALTLREPQDEMIEVAIVALKAAMSGDESAQSARNNTRVFRNFADVVARQGH